MTTPQALPNGICHICQRSAPVMEHVSGKRAIFCEHNSAGAILQDPIDAGPFWTIWVPLSREEFVDQVQRFAELYRAAKPSHVNALQ